MADSSSETFKITIPAEEVEGRIFLIRDQRVMLDTDVAQLYQVPTVDVDKAVLDNPHRFPKDFYFEVNDAELKTMAEQMGFKPADDGTPTLAFSEAGVAMLSCVLDSSHAQRMSIAIMRSFVQFRQVCVPQGMVATKEDLATLMQSLANALQSLDDKNDTRIQSILGTLKQMALGEDPPPERQIGFDTGLNN